MKKVIFTLSLLGLIISLLIIIIPEYRYYAEENQFIELTNIINNIDNRGDDEFNKYDELYKINDDMIGWIKIEGTNIDYPVMYSKESEEYYLNHSFYKEWSLSGTPFTSKNYDEDNNNILIYAHNVDNKTLFGQLLKYRDKNFWSDNQYIYFDTLTKENKYQIISVFESKIFYENENIFKYYKMDYNMNEEEFNNYINNIKKLSLYDIDIEAVYGDKIITLSTCINEVKDRRFVVVAKLIND